MKKTFKIFLAILLLLVLTGVWLYFSAKNAEIPSGLTISACHQDITPDKMEWKVPIFDNFSVFGVKISVPNRLRTVFTRNTAVVFDHEYQKLQWDDANIPIKIAFPSHIEVTDENNTVIYSGVGTDNITVKKNGIYHFNVKTDISSIHDYRGYGNFEYNFDVEVKTVAKISFSQDKIYQGDLLRVTVDNIFADNSLSVKCAFTPSAIVKKENSAFFYIPITYYKAEGSYPLSIMVDDVSYDVPIVVNPAKFSTVHFTVEESVSSSTVNSAAANKEYREKIHPLYKTRSDQQYWEGSFIKPVTEKRISSTFGQKRFINNSKTPERHSGIDYAAAEGTAIYAPNRGMVEFAGFLKLSGYTIVIEHGLGLKSYYFHMKGVDVAAGQMVEKGDKIGEVGSTGYSTGPHLHFQVSIDNQPINPEFLYGFN